MAKAEITNNLNEGEENTKNAIQYLIKTISNILNNHYSNIETLYKAIDYSENIYDLYIQLFKFLELKESDVRTELMTYDGDYKKFYNYRKSVIRNILESIKNGEYDICARNQLKEYLKQVKMNTFLIFIYALFVEIDDVFGVDGYYFSYSDDESLGERYITINPLNSIKTQQLGSVYFNRESLLKRLNSDTKFTRLSSRLSFGTSYYIHNLTICSKNETDYKINIKQIKCNYILNKLEQLKDNVNIAMVPFTGDINYLNVTYEKSYFEISSVNDEQYQHRIINIMNTLKEAGAHIVVFPEMIMSRSILNILTTYLKKNNGHFVMIIAGTIWEDNSNTCSIINGNGILIDKQIKINPYQKKEDMEEFGNNEGIIVNSANKIINIYDIEGLGRVAFPICVDFTIPKYSKWLYEYGVNMIFLPTYTNSISEFVQKAKELGKSNHASVFMANCCSPKIKRIILDKSEKDSIIDKDISFCYLPLKYTYTYLERDHLRNKGIRHIIECCYPKTAGCKCNSKKVCYFMVKIKYNDCNVEISSL